MALSNMDKAIYYAAFKELERILKADGDLPPGFQANVGGKTVTITLNPDTIISRDKGLHGDGVIRKRATQNLYGIRVWGLFLKRLAKFNQANAVKQIIREVWAEVMRTPNEELQEKLEEIDPELIAYGEALVENGPVRVEKTPRNITRKTMRFPAMSYAA